MRIDDIPKTIRDFAETKGGIEKLLTQYNIDVCEVCGELGIRFTSPPMVTRKLATTHYAYFHYEPKPLIPFPETLQGYLEELSYNLQPPTFPTEPARFCVSDKVAVETAKGKRQICPKCGQFGTGESVYHGQRRFWHDRNRTCYLGPEKPKTKKTAPSLCPKCGLQGRPFSYNGQSFVRHKNGQCRIGKADVTNEEEQSLQPSVA